MYMDDHGTPHCHAIYEDDAGSFSFENEECLAGQCHPQKQRKLKLLS